MRNILVDAGPIIALFDQSDQYHTIAKTYLAENPCWLHTTWPVLTEAFHTLSFNILAQKDFLEWINRGAIKLFLPDENHFDPIISRFEKYQDLEPDLADLTLLITAEELSIDRIFSFDSDFDIYRLKSGAALQREP